MHLIASVISTRKLGFYVDIVTDGSLYIGAYALHCGGADFIPGTGSRSIGETLAYIEAELLGGDDQQALAYWEKVEATEPESVTYEEWRTVNALRARVSEGK